ncbi:MAG: hypothetical protein WDA47_06915 [Bacilli bacterium]
MRNKDEFIEGQYTEEELDRLLSVADPAKIESIDFSRLDRVQIEKVFRWGLSAQIKDLSKDLDRLSEVVSGLRVEVNEIGALELKNRIEQVSNGLDDLKKQVGNVPIETLREGVAELRSKVDAIRESLLRCDTIQLSKRVDTLHDWMHRREVLLSTDIIKDLKENMNTSKAFQIKVMSATAVIISISSLLITVLKMFMVK